MTKSLHNQFIHEKPGRVPFSITISQASPVSGQLSLLSANIRCISRWMNYVVITGIKELLLIIDFCKPMYAAMMKSNKTWDYYWILIWHPRGPLQYKFEGSRSIRSRVIAKKPKNGLKWPKNEVFDFPYIFWMVWPREFKLKQFCTQDELWFDTSNSSKYGHQAEWRQITRIHKIKNTAALQATKKFNWNGSSGTLYFTTLKRFQLRQI